MIGAKMEPRPFRRTGGDCLEKVGLKQTILMMAFLGPRVRKKHPNLRKGDGRRQRMQELQGLRAYHVTVGQASPLNLATGPLDPIAAQIDANAKLGRKFGRIPREKVSMAAANFQDDRPRVRQNCAEFRSQIGAALSDEIDKFRSEIHGPLLAGAGREGQS